MRSCSISDVVVVQVPNKAVIIPRAVDTNDVNTAICMDRAFNHGQCPSSHKNNTK